MNYKNLNIKGLDFQNMLGNGNKLLLIVLGVFGDFDSFEYVQAIKPKLQSINQVGIKISIVGIGSEHSKKIFSKYTKIPLEYLIALPDSSLHNHLMLKEGPSFKLNNFLNLFLMCSGIGSPGTLKEVIRGYYGDKKAKNIFKEGDVIRIFKGFEFNASLFDNAGLINNLRPFELATRRLQNLIEVISKWSIYMPNNKFITQRGGTFLIDSDGDSIYNFRSRALLGYSEDMSNPLKFLDIYINND